MEMELLICSPWTCWWGYGDKDDVVNGVIKDPSAAGTATLDPDEKVNDTLLNIVDTAKSLIQQQLF